jgi:MoxR-like ATPase
MLKMLAIYVRVRCGIPVVLMGECGCGKTMSISEYAPLVLRPHK